MIQIYDALHKRIAAIDMMDDLKIEKTLSSGDKELSFSYPKNGAAIAALAAENYIRTKEDEYVLKEIETGATKNRYVAKLNIEELEQQEFTYGFESQTQTARACLEFAFEGTGWTVGTCTITKRRTVDIEDACTAWDVLQDVLKTYMCECRIDSIRKVIHLYEHIGTDRGAYFMEGLNLRKLTVKSNTYDFYTRIYPIGKDGITPEIMIGVPYIDNHQYTDKIVPKIWKDERYTITENLIEDARAKLETASRPYTAYTADVADLAAQSEEYGLLDYDIGDTVWIVSKTENTRTKQRIVKMTEYPKDPQKNTCELSSVVKTFEQIQTAGRVLDDRRSPGGDHIFGRKDRDIRPGDPDRIAGYGIGGRGSREAIHRRCQQQDRGADDERISDHDRADIHRLEHFDPVDGRDGHSAGRRSGIVQTGERNILPLHRRRP